MAETPIPAAPDAKGVDRTDGRGASAAPDAKGEKTSDASVAPDAVPAVEPELREREDLTQTYGAHVETRQFQSVVEQARARQRAFQKAERRPTGTTEPGEDAAAAAAELREETVPQTTPKDAVVDVTVGVAETPRAAVRGALEGAQEIVTSFKHAAEWALDADLGADPDMPRPDAPRTFTGSLVEDAFQFLLGFGAAGKALKAAGVLQKGGRATAAARTELRAAASDALAFDENEQNLAAFLQRHAGLADPVTQFLATDPADGEAVNRLRRALEGAGIGAAAEGLLRAFQFYRARRATSPDGSRDAAPAADAEPAIGDRDFLILGDPEAPLFEVRAPRPEDGSAKMRRGLAETGDTPPQSIDATAQTRQTDDPLGGRDVFINFARIDGPDDVRRVMGEMADLYSDSIDTARRGVQSNAETRRLANLLGMTVPDLLARRRGQPLNAEQALAARRIWADSAAKLIEAAKVAAQPNAGPVDQFAFRKMMAIHQSIQAEVIGARTETARALQAWAIPAGPTERARAVQSLLEAYGGPEASAAMARRLAILAENDAAPAAIAGFVRRGWAARSLDMVKESFVNGLLWSPKTHLVNTASNTLVAAMQIAERAMAGRISSLRGARGGEGVAAGEEQAMLYGLVTAQKDAFRLATKALTTGERFDALGKIDLVPEPAISARQLATEREAGRVARGEVGQAEALAAVDEFTETGLGRAIDFFGAVTRTPGNLLGAEDAYFKTIGYRMELHAQSLRQAVAEGHTGPAAARRMMEIVQDPPEQIRLAAADAALYNTFTQPSGPVAKALLGLRRIGEDSPFGILNPAWLLLPFLRTPTNILRYTFERTPMAPAVGQWRADIAAGGARRDIALARMAAGSSIMMVALDYAYSGYITGRGPDDHRERQTLERQGWQPYSVWRADPSGEGGDWVSYSRTDPLGLLLGVGAGISEIMRTRDVSPEDADEISELLAMAVTSVGTTVKDKTYFTGVANFVQAMEEPERYGAAFLERTLSSLIPFSVALSTAESGIDPVYRDANSVLEFVQSRLPVLSESLPVAMDIWGRPRGPQEAWGKAYEVLSPARVRRFEASPIDAELDRLGVTLSRIPKKTSFDGADINFRDWPRVYEQYVRLAGNALEHPVYGKGLKDFLDAVVGGKSEWSALYELEADTAEGRGRWIRQRVQEYRALAREAILADPAYERFRLHWEEKAYEQRRARTPAGIQLPKPVPGPADGAAGAPRRSREPAAGGPMTVPSSDRGN